MSNSTHAAHQFSAVLLELAEGRLPPDQWLAWWDNHAGEVEAALSRGWFLKLKPKQLSSGADRSAVISQSGACEILTALGISFIQSDRYEKGWKQDFRQFVATEASQQQVRIQAWESRFIALGEEFPKLGELLRKRAADIEQFDEPATAAEIASVQQRLDVVLPDTLQRFLKITSHLQLDRFVMGLSSITPHEMMIGEGAASRAAIVCGEYWLEADGDQLLMEHSRQSAPDAPLYYYVHSTGKVRKLANTLVEWFDSLAKSPVFRH